MIDEALWEALESTARKAPGLVRRRVREESSQDLFIGVTLPNHVRVLVLSVATSAVLGLKELPETRALSTTVEEGIDENHVEVRISLIAREMSRVFTPFVEDVLDAVAPTATDNDAVAALVARFSYWRNLFSGSRPEGLSRSEQQGLYGELWCLRHVMVSSLGDNAIAAWTGPEREDRDFHFGGVGVEVKTTVLDNPATVEISSERQLDITPLNTLYLVVLSLDALPAGTGQTLNALVDGLFADLGNGALQILLRDRLIAYGYLDVDRSRYDTTRYTVRQMRCFIVDENFPRIIESSLPDGIGRVRYRLSLDACSAFAIAEDKLRNRLEREPVP